MHTDQTGQISHNHYTYISIYIHNIITINNDNNISHITDIEIQPGRPSGLPAIRFDPMFLQRAAAHLVICIYPALC